MLQKPHTCLWSTETLVCLELQREGDVTLLHIGLREVRDYHKVKTDFLGHKNGDAEYLWGLLFVSGSAGHAWECVFIWAEASAEHKKGQTCTVRSCLYTVFVVFLLFFFSFTTSSRECWFQSRLMKLIQEVWAEPVLLE